MRQKKLKKIQNTCLRIEKSCIFAPANRTNEFNTNNKITILKMKKLALTLAIVLGMSMYSFASMDNQGGGLFGYGKSSETTTREGEDNPLLPGHGASGNQDGNAPLGSGIVALVAFGAAYAFAKKRED